MVRTSLPQMLFQIYFAIAFLTSSLARHYENITDLIQEISPDYPGMFESTGDDSMFLDVDGSSSQLLLPSYLLLTIAGCFSVFILNLMTG